LELKKLFDVKDEYRSQVGHKGRYADPGEICIVNAYGDAPNHIIEINGGKVLHYTEHPSDCSRVVCAAFYDLNEAVPKDVELCLLTKLKYRSRKDTTMGLSDSKGNKAV
jgi:hypothetical protein